MKVIIVAPHLMLLWRSAGVRFKNPRSSREAAAFYGKLHYLYEVPIFFFSIYQAKEASADGVRSRAAWPTG